MTRLFGKEKSTDGKAIELISEQIDLLSSQITMLHDHLDALDQVVLKLVEIGGGEGWTQTVQNAIKHLDTRVGNVEIVANACAQLFEKLTEDGDEGRIIVFPSESDKEEIQ